MILADAGDAPLVEWKPKSNPVQGVVCLSAIDVELAISERGQDTEEESGDLLDQITLDAATCRQLLQCDEDDTETEAPIIELLAGQGRHATTMSMWEEAGSPTACTPWMYVELYKRGK